MGGSAWSDEKTELLAKVTGKVLEAMLPTPESTGDPVLDIGVGAAVKNHAAMHGTTIAAAVKETFTAIEAAGYSIVKTPEKV